MQLCFSDQDTAKMPTKIFVGRLAEGTTSEDILGLFRKFGTVTECDVISNYGFVVSI
jgi:RNA recognition motif-containing protein